MAKRKVTTICAIALVALIAARCGSDKIARDHYNEYKDSLPKQSQEQVYNDYQPAGQDEVPVNNQVSNFTYFEDAKTTLRNYANREQWENFKTTGKNYLVTGIDFIFYDKPINGVYFSQLSSSAKKSVIRALANIDTAIMEYYPDYKEEISSKYNLAANYLDTKYLATLDSIKQYLGEEQYNNISNGINDTKDKIGEGYKKGSSLIKEKYEQWRK